MIVTSYLFKYFQFPGPYRFRNLTHKFLNATTLRVSWGGSPATYTVQHSAQLKLPVEQWAAVNTTGNIVLVSIIILFFILEIFLP